VGKRLRTDIAELAKRGIIIKRRIEEEWEE
jgi:hypothetical protein